MNAEQMRLSKTKDEWEVTNGKKQGQRRVSRKLEGNKLPNVKM